MDIDSVRMPGSWRDGPRLDRMDVDCSLEALVSAFNWAFEAISLIHRLRMDAKVPRPPIELGTPYASAGSVIRTAH